MPDFSALQNDDLATAQCVRGRESEQARADDDDVGALRFGHVTTVRTAPIRLLQSIQAELRVFDVERVDVGEAGSLRVVAHRALANDRAGSDPVVLEADREAVERA